MERTGRRTRTSRESNRHGLRRAGRTGQGRGFTLIELLIVIAVIGILAAAAVPNFMASNKSANETSAIASMKSLISAEETYRLTHKKYGVLSQLKDTNLVNPLLGSGSKSGYTFLTFGDPNTQEFAFIAIPQLNRGDRFYFIDQTGTLRSDKTDHIGPDSEPVN